MNHWQWMQSSGHGMFMLSGCILLALVGAVAIGYWLGRKRSDSSNDG